MLDGIEIVNVGKLLRVRVTGKLTKEFYQEFVPTIEELIKKHGKVRVLLELHDFHGWTAGGLWEDVKFDVKHWNHIERLAIVGETKWEHGMATFCKPFTSAKIQYFDASQGAEAKTWIEEA